MIKLDYEAVKNTNDEYQVKCNGTYGGKRGELIMEIEAVLESFEDQMPKEFSNALEIFLSKRGC